MKGFKNTLSAANLPMLLLGVGTVLAGTGAAALHGNFEVLAAILCMLFAMFCQLSSGFFHRYLDLVNNYGEYLDVDACDIDESPNVLAEIRKAGAQSMSLLAATVGITIFGLAGWWTILIGLLVWFVAWLNNAGPMPLFRTPAAMVVPWLLFGPIGVIGTLMVEADVTPGDVWQLYYFLPGISVGLACGFLAANVQLAFSFIHYERDIQNCKDSFCVRFGRRATRMMVLVNGVLAFVSMLVYVIWFEDRSPLMMLLPGVMGMMVSVAVMMLMSYERKELNRMILQLSVWNVLIFGLLTLIIGLIVGDPDRLGTLY